MTRVKDSSASRKRAQSVAMRTTQARRNPGPQLPPIEEGNPLQVVIRRRMIELGPDYNDDGRELSAAQVADIARAGGHTLSASTMTNIVGAKAKPARLRESVLEALAFALELDVETLRRAMNRALAGVEMRIPTKLAKKITPEGWAELIAHAEYLAERDS